MSYETKIQGQFALYHPLEPNQTLYLQTFSNTRRMKRKASIARNMPDPIRINAKISLGKDAQFFTGGIGLHGQDKDPSIINFNQPPASQPGLWCPWTIFSDNQTIIPIHTKTPYEFNSWLHFIIENFVKRWNNTLNGSIIWQGEKIEDRGKTIVKDNVIQILYAKFIDVESSSPNHQ